MDFSRTLVGEARTGHACFAGVKGSIRPKFRREKCEMGSRGALLSLIRSIRFPTVFLEPSWDIDEDGRESFLRSERESVIGIDS